KALRNLDFEQQDHEAHEKSLSYVGTFLSNFNHSYSQSASDLAQLKRDIAGAKKRGDTDSLQRYVEQADGTIKADRKAIGTQNTVDTIGGGLLKGAGLFARGPIAIAGTV